MNLLISGGFGFIGSYLIDKLLAQGHTVGVISRKVPDYLIGLARKTDVYLADVTKPIRFEHARDYDIFIHLAAANDVDSFDPAAALSCTTLGTKNCLEFCKEYGIKRFIYFSTFQVYGARSSAVDEKTPLHCMNDYAITHRFAEEYVEMYQRNYGLEYIIVRPTNVYGACVHKQIDRWSLVPNCFCKEAFEKRMITLISSGRQIRNFISLEDVVNLTIILCKRFEQERNSFLNLASGCNITILEVAEMVKEIYEKIFGVCCSLYVRSDVPATSQDLTVDMTRIRGMGYVYSEGYSMRKEIEKIFRLLRG